MQPLWPPSGRKSTYPNVQFCQATSNYPVMFLDVQTLGYHSSGEPIRGQDFTVLVAQIAAEYHGSERDKADVSKSGEGWRWFTRSSVALGQDKTRRFDFKYWNTELTAQIDQLKAKGAPSIRDLNLVKTRRGKSPSASLYVDETDGHALVVKAGTNITRFGTIARNGDYVEKSVFDELSIVHLLDGDVLLSSTGDGTLGKCAVYRGDAPAIFDGHVTLIRLDQTEAHPEYVCDFLRAGFGADQISRLYTGSTGLIELPPEQVDEIIVPLPKLEEQIALSAKLREDESAYAKSLNNAGDQLKLASFLFKSKGIAFN